MNVYPTLRRNVYGFLNLSLSDQVLFVEASLLLIFLRICLKYISFHILYKVLKHLLHKPQYSFTKYLDYTKRVVWAVKKSGNYFLHTKCLAEAIAVHILLNKKRIDNKIQIGFIKSGTNISGHAWICAENRVLFGDDRHIHLYFRFYQSYGK